MEEVSAELLASQLYQEGLSNFESGNYQQAIALLERAQNLVAIDSNLSGEILIWLANSYDATGKTEQAIAICRSLKKHPTGSVRKSARYMLGILTAPQLSKLEGVVSEVPILESPDSYQSKPITNTKPRSNNQKPFREIPLQKPVSDSKNNFLWFAIAISLISLIVWYGALS